MLEKVKKHRVAVIGLPKDGNPRKGDIVADGNVGNVLTFGHKSELLEYRRAALVLYRLEDGGAVTPLGEIMLDNYDRKARADEFMSRLDLFVGSTHPAIVDLIQSQWSASPTTGDWKEKS